MVAFGTTVAGRGSSILEKTESHHYLSEQQPQQRLLSTIPQLSRAGTTALIDNYSDLTSRHDLDNLEVRNMLMRQIELTQRELSEQKIQWEQELSQQQEENKLETERILQEGMVQLEEERLSHEKLLEIHQRLEIAMEHQRLTLQCEEQHDETAGVTAQSAQVQKQMLEMQSDMVCLMMQVQNASDELVTIQQDHEADLLERQQAVLAAQREGEAKVQEAVLEGRAQQIQLAQQYKQELQKSEEELRQELDLWREAKFDGRNLDGRLARLERDRSQLNTMALLLLQLLLQRTWVFVSTVVIVVFDQFLQHVWQHPRVQRQIHHWREKVVDAFPQPTTRSNLQLLLRRLWNLTWSVGQQFTFLLRRLWKHPKAQQSRRYLRRQIESYHWRSKLETMLQQLWHATTSVLRLLRMQWNLHVWKNPAVKRQVGRFRDLVFSLRQRSRNNDNSTKNNNNNNNKSKEWPEPSR
ncbi:hypothetical protein ACA910_004285 [Epithemia clementina (nom. ined.)]